MYPESYIQYLVHFHGDRDYFECHEILEEYWKSQPVREHVWVGLIQLAVGLYHQRRGNFAGAHKMLKSSFSILRSIPEVVTGLGLDPQELDRLLEMLVQHAAEGKPYQMITLPIANQQLLARCQEQCEKEGFLFGQSSAPADESILHRHTLRDRSEVIREREQQLQRKRY